MHLLFTKCSKDSKSFITSKPGEKRGLYIGGEKNGRNFNGLICAIDITNHPKNYHETPDNIPIEIRDLLINDHVDRTD